ncbi:class I SAM-dependent methyltransferase [Variovorax sp. ZS18.2.2]|uniref:O-methyltransferase n=1 Tax=Variovorax sp. ZS18.2.2 TaxID=2971255 RepID=UPI002150E19D|nr:class I SAM-dependent methyltransferase [Variovorax sp. ZS18.2.2]MCR6477087.1 class I SAM-dependent methyltransferase [Variovorax sp. ZS18.2.2]
MTLDELNRKFAEVPARHKEVSIIASMDDEPARPSRRLMDIALQACSAAMDVALPIYEGRASKEPHWFDTWPGEHYRLLAALVRTLNPKTVIEIGTFTGMGTLALAQDLQPSGTLTTFDLLAWDSFADTWLAPADFTGGRVRQVLHDISTPGGIEPHRALFESADLIFVDGPKDGRTEADILANLTTLKLSRDVVIVFDDIRVVNMIDIWRRVAQPKMDLTSFGHWSGTGLIDWNGTSDL